MFQMFSSLAIDMNPFRRDLRQARTEAQQTVNAIEQGTSQSTGVWSRIGKAMSSTFSGGKTAANDFYGQAEKGAGRLKSIFDGMKGIASSIFTGIGQGAGQAVFSLAAKGADFFKSSLFDLNNEMEAAQAKINAFTKDAGKTNDILAYLNKEAAATPFAFQDMADAAGALMPVMKSSGKSLEDLMKTAEILGASNPLQGLAGASFALREAMTGDFTSLEERFDLSRVQINKWKEEGVSNFEIVQRAMKDMGYDSDLVAKMGETLTGRWSTFQDTISAVMRTITNPLFNVLKGWLAAVQTRLDTMMPRIQEFATLWGDRIAKGVERASSFFAGLIPVLVNLKDTVEPVVRGVASGIGSIVDAVQKFASGQINFSQFIGGIQIFVTTVLGNLRDLDAKASPYLDAFLTTVSSWIAAAAPQVGAQMMLWGRSFVDWIGTTAIPWITPKLTGLLTTVTGWITQTAAPEIGTALVGWGQQFGTWVTGTAIPWVRQNLPGWVDAISTWITQTGVPAVGGALGQMGTALGDWVATTAVPWVKANLPGWIDAITGWITDTGVPALTTGVTKMADGLVSWLTGGTARNETHKGLQSWIDVIIAHLASGIGVLEDFGKIAGPKLSDWIKSEETQRKFGDLVKATAKGTGDVLNALNDFSQNAGKETNTWLEESGPKWLTSWSELYRITDEQNRKISQREVQLENELAASIGTWINTAGPAWLHDWGVLWTTLDTQASAMSKRTGILFDDLGASIHNFLPRWLTDWGALGNAMAAGLGSGANAAIDVLNNFGDQVAGVISNIMGFLGTKNAVQFPHVPHVGWGMAQPQGGSTVPGGSQLSKGTDNWGGGWAWVGEGHGGSGAELAYLPPGAKVIPHEESMRMVQVGAVPGFADGLNNPLDSIGSLFDVFKNGPDWLLQKAISALGFSPPKLPGALTAAAPAFFNQVKGWIGAWLADFVKKALPVGADQVQAMINFAESQIGLPYIWGGGHGGGGGPGVGFDCSGFVAAVLDAGGIPNPHGIVTDFYNWMAKNGGNGVVDIGVWQPTNPDPTQQHVGIRLLGTDYESGGVSGGVGRNGTRFPEYGTPPGLAKASAPGSLSDIDVETSLRNMRLGVKGQWSGVKAYAKGGVIDELVTGIGQTTGRPYLFGEDGPEIVTPVSQGSGSRGLPTGPTGGDRPRGQNADPTKDPSSPRYLGPPGTGTFDEELKFPPGDDLLPEWDARRRILDVPTSADVKARRDATQNSGTGGSRGGRTGPAPTSDWGPKSGPIGTTGPSKVRGASANEQVQHAIATGDFIPGDLMEDDPSIIGALTEWQLRHVAETGDFVPKGTGLLEDDPQVTKALDQWRSKKGGAPVDASAPTPSSTAAPGPGISATVDEMAASVRDGINASFLFTVFGGGKNTLPSTTPGNGPTDPVKPTVDNAPVTQGDGERGRGGTSVNPTPVTEDGGIRSRYYYGNGSGSLIPGRATDAVGRAGAGMKGHFPEDVVPDPGTLGRWIGVVTNTIYAADGSVVEAGDYNNQRGPGPVTPSGTGGQPMGGGPAPVYPWGLDPNGRPSPNSPLDGVGRLSNTPDGASSTITIKLTLDGSGSDIVRMVSADSDAAERLAAMGFQLLLDNAPKR